MHKKTNTNSQNCVGWDILACDPSSVIFLPPASLCGKIKILLYQTCNPELQVWVLLVVFLLFAKGFLAVVRIAKKEYFTPTTHPPPARKSNYRGSRCLTKRCGNSHIHSAPAGRIRTPVHCSCSLQYPSYHNTVTYLDVCGFSIK